MAGVGRLERGEPRHQPLLGDRLDRDDADPPGPAALPFGDSVDLGEDALHLLQVGLVAAFEQRGAKMVLQHADAVSDGGRGDLKFLSGAYEVLVPGGGEEAEAIEGRPVIMNKYGYVYEI